MHRLICNQKNVNFSIVDAPDEHNIKQQPSSPLRRSNPLPIVRRRFDGVVAMRCYCSSQYGCISNDGDDDDDIDYYLWLLKWFLRSELTRNTQSRGNASTIGRMPQRERACDKREIHLILFSWQKQRQQQRRGWGRKRKNQRQTHREKKKYCIKIVRSIKDASRHHNISEIMLMTSQMA